MLEKKKYSGEFKFNLVLEVLKNDNIAQIARNYGVNPNLVSRWKVQFLERGPTVFSTDPDRELLKVKKEKANLERLVGKKETELNLLKNFSEFYGYTDGN